MTDAAAARMKQAEATVLFADLVGFTALSEKLTASEVAELLEGYFTHSVDAIFAAGGTLDKFIGDCVMAFFGAPVPQADHALRAVQRGACRSSTEQEALEPRSARRAACRRSRCGSRSTAARWWSATSAARSASTTRCSATRSTSRPASRPTSPIPATS